MRSAKSCENECEREKSRREIECERTHVQEQSVKVRDGAKELNERGRAVWDAPTSSRKSGGERECTQKKGKKKKGAYERETVQSKRVREMFVFVWDTPKAAIMSQCVCVRERP